MVSEAVRICLLTIFIVIFTKFAGLIITQLIRHEAGKRYDCLVFEAAL